MKYLILVKNEDKTEQINRCEYLNGEWQIIYNNNNKIYTYNYLNVVWYKNPKVINNEAYIVFCNDEPISGIEKILDFGEYIRIIFLTGYKKSYPRSNIIIESNCLNGSAAHNSFEYLKKLSYSISVNNVDDISFLSKQYNKLTTISPRSVLSNYLEKKPFRKQARKVHPIFPFGFNLSQKSATEKALKEQASIIEGPPGTGKTQTILNIIANAVMNGNTVAVVSNNNSATANVLEKLQKYGVDFIAAYLGNNDNKDKFFVEQNSKYPDMRDWVLSYSDSRTIKEDLVKSEQKLNEMLECQNKQALLKNELSCLLIEHEYFGTYYNQLNMMSIKLGSFLRITADKILEIMLDYQQKIEKGNFSFKTKLFNLFVYGIYSWKFYNNTPDDVISFLQKTYYDIKIEELKRQIEILSNKLNNYNFDKEMKEYSEKSMKLFNSELADRFDSSKARKTFSQDSLWKSFDDFIIEYPVILSTTHSLRNCAKENYLFDYVIIDEASQVDLVTGSLALSCAKNTVIVGDIKQLPNVVTPEVAEATKQIFKSYELEEAYSYADNSLLTSFTKLFDDIPKTLLKEHYRCHPKIIGFCNQKYYDNQLIILTDERKNDKPLIIYKTTKGSHARGNLNQRQIDVIFEEIMPDQNIDELVQSVGIISPYRLQTNELIKVIGTRNIEADTVHKYQGREKDIIILTTVANEVLVNDFVDNPNLINVAVSRAVKKLIVVVSDGSEDWYGTNIYDLIRYIQYNNLEVVESQIYSVFDLLYSSYSKKILEVIKIRKNVSDYKSENLMNVVIEKVLEQPEFNRLDRVIHQPLKLLIKDMSQLNEDEYKYASNILTHTDFVIFDKIDKIPVLVVEVDGYAFHENNPKQKERDNLKDSILQKYGIPIIRIKTNESGEEKKLREKLMEVLKLGTYH